MFRDTVITAQQKRRELLIILLCFAGANVFNLIGIIMFKTPIKELLTQFHIVLFVTIFFYILIAFGRALYWLVRGVLLRK